MSLHMSSGFILIFVCIITQCIFSDGKDATTKACQKGWTLLSLKHANVDGPVCVKLNPNATFLKAVEDCRKEGGDLATILNLESQNALHDFLNGTKTKHWIGLSDFSYENSFKWTSGYLGVPAFFWGDKEPNNYMNHQDCVAIDPTALSNQSWFDEYCTQSLPSVCMIAKFKGAPKNVVLETKNGTCVEGFFRMGNRCLKIFTDKPANFNDARKQCQKLASKNLSGDLASIYSAEEQNILTAMMLNKSIAVWIGLRLDTATNTRMWVRGFHDVTFTNWKVNEPNGGHSVTEQCVMMYKRSSSPGEWNDHKCSTKLGFICGMDLNPGENDKNATVPFFSSAGNCNAGEVEFNNYCYKSLDQDFSSYEGADKACQKFNRLGHLATPHNAFENAFISIMMNHFKINFTLLGFQIKETKTDYEVQTADGSLDIGLESLKGVNYFDVKDTSCISSTGNPQHKVSVTNCSGVPFKPVCSYPLKTNPLHPSNMNYTCEAGWTLISGGRCIKLFDEKKTKTDAEKTCKEKYKGNLVSILNVHDQQAVINVVKRANNDVWIGLQVSFAKPALPPSFRWSDGSPVLFLSWRVNEPSATSRSKKVEACVVVRHKSTDWNNVQCDKTNEYMCSVPSISPTAKPLTPSSTPTPTSKPTPTPTSKPTPTTSKPTPTPTPTTMPKCPKDFKEGPSDNCYQVFKLQKTWRDAEEHCKKFSKGHLASIHSLTEQKFVNGLAIRYKLPSMWIGLSDLYGKFENQFSYWSDNSAITVVFMDSTKDGYFGNQDCVSFAANSSSHGVWKKKHCTTKAAGFVCMIATKRKPSPRPLPPDSSSNGKYCEQGFTEFNKTCYRLMTKPENYTQANIECKNLFSEKRSVTLARIDNVENNDFLLSLLSPIKNSNAWIGMHFENEEFHWIDNKPIHFTKWPVNMSSTNKNTTCVTLGASTMTILSGFWHARNCHEKYPFLCQAPMTATKPTSSKLKCKEPYKLYPDGKTCYRRLNLPTTFDDGIEQCKKDQTKLGLKTTPNLLSIDNVFEMSFIRAWMIESGTTLDRTVWVGLKLKKDKPKWVWTTGAPVEFTYTSGLPDDIYGCYYTYIHRKVTNREEYKNVYGMHPDPTCGKSPYGKRTVVCKYYLKSKAIVPKPNDCLATKDGIGYTGHHAETKSGKACERWDTLNDMHLQVQLNQKIGGSDSNFCRNPPGKPYQRDRPYCYTTRGNSAESPKWEYCDIPLCSTNYNAHVGSHRYVVAVAILVIVLLVTISFFVGVLLWRRTNTARGFIPYLRQHDPEGGTSFHNPIYTPAANC